MKEPLFIKQWEQTYKENLLKVKWNSTMAEFRKTCFEQLKQLVLDSSKMQKECRQFHEGLFS
jgi:hypothetical protein